MNWLEIPSAAPVSMPGLLAFIERWKPGSTTGFKAASPAQIAALADFYGGLEVLPPVYRAFLATRAVLERTYTFLLRLGFATTELGVSTSAIPLENSLGRAIALLSGSSDCGASLQLRARDAVEERTLVEFISDHKPTLMGAS